MNFLKKHRISIVSLLVLLMGYFAAPNALDFSSKLKHSNLLLDTINTISTTSTISTISNHTINNANSLSATAIAGFDTLSVTELPKEGQQTLRLIQAGGPFPYSQKDGSIFSNRERKLPFKPRGYYSEYTVKTPYAKNRGARRIVAGQGKTGNPATSGEYFYTEDHYATFKQIDLKK
jgi:ribonuclease T1